MLVATFFATLYEVNATCMRLVSGSKENVAAIQGVQDRLETLRNLAYSDLTNATYVKDLMASPSNASDFAKGVVEEVTITAYNIESPTGGTTGTGMTIRRPAGASGPAAFVGTPDSTITDSKAVLVRVKYDWTMALAKRPRSEETSSIIAAGVKK